MARDTDWKLTRTFTGTSGDIRWDRLGPPGRPPVVPYRGTPFSSYVCRAVARSLARDHQVFAWDMPHVFERLPPALLRALVREYVGSAGSPGLHPAVLDRLVAPWLDGPGQAAFYRQISQADQRCTDEIQSRYGGIGDPTLVCWGEDDTWIPVAKGRELAVLVPGARFEPIAGAGHLVQEDAPAELTAALVAFLQQPR
ncbi:alpha/beta fold hydrolase [Streptomyces sp. NPDC014995]|uniref:alpha/beta fold hydrolase n=1 Tax=Streptomyces sp. NPDC014995 TaxID=3364936 RepID=UPI0036FA81C9